MESTSSAAETVADNIKSAASSVGAAVGGAAAAVTAPFKSGDTPAGHSGSGNTESTLYVGNIFFEVNEQSLEDYFGRYGQINKVKIIYDARGLSKGYVSSPSKKLMTSLTLQQLRLCRVPEQGRRRQGRRDRQPASLPRPPPRRAIPPP